MHAFGAWLLGWDSAGVFFSNGIFVNLINYINNKQTSLKLLKRTKNTRTVARMGILGISPSLLLPKQQQHLKILCTWPLRSDTGCCPFQFTHIHAPPKQQKNKMT